jgi:hypothetical protein
MTDDCSICVGPGRASPSTPVGKYVHRTGEMLAKSKMQAPDKRRPGLESGAVAGRL